MNVGKWFSDLNLKQKVRFLFIIAIGMCVIFCFMLFYFVLRNRMTSTVLENGRNSLNSIGQNIETEIEIINNISKLIMVNDKVTDYLHEEYNPVYSNTARNEIYTILNSFSGSYPVFVFRNDRNFINTSSGIISAIPSVVFNEKWITDVRLRDGGYILLSNNAGAFTNKSSMGTTVIFARIINDIDTQKPIGLLAIHLPVSIFEQSYMSLADTNNHFAYLDANGNIICSDNSDFIDITDINLNVSGMQQNIYGGLVHKQVTTIANVTNSDFKLVCCTTMKIMEGMTAEVAWSLSGIFLVTIAWMILINKYINKYITAPIHKLADSMSQVEKGLLNSVDISSNNDEIGILKESYNEMIIQLNNLISKLIEQEKNRQKAEMRALQEQIKPHFLYNTLDTIGYMSLEKKPEEIYDAIETLGNFYRKFLSKGSPTISLSDEIAIVKDYIKLQKLRYEDMFDDEYDIQSGLNGLMVPKLILQPLIENSIYHGIRIKGEKGIIRLTVKADDEFLHIFVFDTGVGMSNEEITMLINNDNHKSFGFKATMERIKYFYRTENVFEIHSEEGKYCEIEIKIPIKEDDTNVQSYDN